jgi:hypothetical protein
MDPSGREKILAVQAETLGDVFLGEMAPSHVDAPAKRPIFLNGLVDAERADGVQVMDDQVGEDLG